MRLRVYRALSRYLAFARPGRYQEECSRAAELVNLSRIGPIMLALLLLDLYFMYADTRALFLTDSLLSLRFLYADLAMLPVLAITFALTLIFRARRPEEVTRFHRVLVRVFALLTMYWCVFIAAVERQASGEIATYFIAVLASSVLLYAGGLYFAFLLLSSLGLLVAVTSAYGMSPGQMFSENLYLEGLLLMSWMISRLLLWAHNRQIISHLMVQEARKKLLRANLKLRSANSQLEEAQLQLIRQEKLASIGQLSAGFAHEIRNPVGFLKSNFSALEQHFRALLPVLEGVAPAGLTFGRIPDLKALQKEIEELFEDSRHGFEQAMRVVNDLLDFSRSQHGGTIEKYDLQAGIESTLVVARSEYREVVEIVREYGDIPLIDCRGDEINHVILNILTNAVQAIRSSGPRPRGTIVIRTWQEDGRVCCSITNDGPPIPEEIKPRVFEPFFTTKAAGQGTGLGLSIAYDIVVKRHGGELVVSGDGPTTFTFSLPVTQAGRSRSS